MAGACGAAPLYHGWSCPIVGCDTTTFDSMAPTADGGYYPYNAGDSVQCRAWKLAATICNAQPTTYFGGTYPPNDNWTCPSSGGFTDPVFGTYCAVTNQYACTDYWSSCNVMPSGSPHGPLSLRDCTGVEVNQQ
jgi:hypothetical protein